MGAKGIAAVALGIAGTAGYLVAAKLNGWWPFAPTEPRQYAVSTSVAPRGGGSVTGGARYTAGATVTLTAVPSPSYTFSSWSGDVTGTANPAYFTMPARNISAVANFTMPHPAYHSLTIEVVGRAKAGVYEVARYPIDGATVALSGPQSGQKITTGGLVNWASLLDGAYTVTITHPSFPTLRGTVTLDKDLIATFQLQGGPIEPTLRTLYDPWDGYFAIRTLLPKPAQPQAPVQGFLINADADDPGWGPHHVDAYIFETDELEVMAPGDPRIKCEYKKPSVITSTYITEDLSDEVYFALFVGQTWAVSGHYIDVVNKILDRGHWPYENRAEIARYSFSGADFCFDNRNGVAWFFTPIKGIGKFLQVSIRGWEEVEGTKLTKWSHLIHEILRNVSES